jgi:hypothetical protein
MPIRVLKLRKPHCRQNLAPYTLHFASCSAFALLPHVGATSFSCFGALVFMLLSCLLSCFLCLVFALLLGGWLAQWLPLLNEFDKGEMGKSLEGAYVGGNAATDQTTVFLSSEHGGLSGISHLVLLTEYGRVRVGRNHV